MANIRDLMEPEFSLKMWQTRQRLLGFQNGGHGHEFWSISQPNLITWRCERPCMSLPCDQRYSIEVRPPHGTIAQCRGHSHFPSTQLGWPRRPGEQKKAVQIELHLFRSNTVWRLRKHWHYIILRYVRVSSVGPSIEQLYILFDYQNVEFTIYLFDKPLADANETWTAGPGMTDSDPDSPHSESQSD